MIPNNNLSVLPWYTSLEEQNARRWWLYGQIYPLFTPGGYLLPWQLAVPYERPFVINTALVYDARTDSVIGNIATDIAAGITTKVIGDWDYLVFPGVDPLVNAWNNGQYYIAMTINGITYYSEVFTVVNDIEPYLKITWWDLEDFVMDAGRIIYTEPEFKNILYLQADIAKPEYPFEEEGETRDGYFFPTKQISEKRYRFNFLASEYLLDVMRFIRMADYAEIEYRGKRYSLDTFLITPKWEDNGDVASVEAVFDTATVAKKIGLGYLKSKRGDFNDDFNEDFLNTEDNG